MSRTEKLKSDMLAGRHRKARVAVSPGWSVADLPLSLPERKAEALCRIFDNCPLYIGEEELIVGSQTVYGHRGEETDPSDMLLAALPECVNGEDIALFGRDDSLEAGVHFTADYGVILKGGIKGIIEWAEELLGGETDPDKAAFRRAVIRAYRGLSRFILRYAAYAEELAAAAAGRRREELSAVAANCRAVAWEPPRTFFEAAQLVWFAELSLLTESFRYINYGRLDQLLFPYSAEGEGEAEQQIIDCLVVKMYDGGDIKDTYLGAYSGQHTLTLGGLTPEGADAVNRVTYMFLGAIRRVGLPEPMVEIRYGSRNPGEFLRAAAEISVAGINTVAYYNDDIFVRNLKAHGLPERDANGYAFGLCQDVVVPGRMTPWVGGMSADFGRAFTETLKKFPDGADFDTLFKMYRDTLFSIIDNRIEGYNRWAAGIKSYNGGDREGFLARVRSGELPLSWGGNSPMAPLPLASAYFDGCLESGTDLALYPYALPYTGMVLGNVAIGVNSLAAVRRWVIDKKEYTAGEVLAACERNYEGDEVMRRRLWNSPKWCNGDDYVDAPARELIESCCRRISSHKNVYRMPYLAGMHQSHQVLYGKDCPATPDGRLAGQPLAVTVSPENGTMKRGPLAAMRSVAGIDSSVYQWNIALMLQFTSDAFAGEEGVANFSEMLTSYFEQGGAQFQPNIVSVEKLRDARVHPENYRDLVVRLWGVSAQFVNLSREVQDEFIARCE